MKKPFALFFSVCLLFALAACDTKMENKMEDRAEKMEDYHETKADGLEKRAEMHRDSAEAYDEAH